MSEKREREGEAITNVHNYKQLQYSNTTNIHILADVTDLADIATNSHFHKSMD